MLNFLARIGKQPWAKMVLPILINGYALSYLGFHHYGHPIATNIFGAQLSSGKREELSEDLQRICMETFNDLKDGYNKPISEIFDNKLLNLKTSPIKWFITASMEPMVFGMSETRTGVLIGLPSFYNYIKEEDIPDSLFEIKKLSLFKNPFESKKEVVEEDEKMQEKKKEENEMEKDEKILSGVKSGSVGQLVTKIDKKSEAGHDYISSLLLSENAKKYSIAKQVHLGDSYKPGIYSLSICVTGILSLFVARGAVVFFKLANAHLFMRLPYYAVSSCLFSGNMIYFSKMIDSNYDKKSEDRTLALGQLYVEGAEEYKLKTELRNKVLSSYLS